MLNNPLKFTDQSGEFFFLAIATLVGAYIGGAQANGSYNPFDWDWSSGATWGGMLGGAVIGVASAGIGMAVASAVAPALASIGLSGGVLGTGLTGLASGAVAGAFSGGFMSQLPGGNGDFWDGMWSGLKMGAVTGFTASGIFGGIKALTNGKSFWTGEALRSKINAASSLKAKGIESVGNKSNNTEITNFDNRKINANVNNADFKLAKTEWNGIKQQYGIKQEFKGLPEGFRKVLPDGTTVTGRFYQGGISNPTGYNIKINTTLPKILQTKIPNVYIRYKLPKPHFKP